MLYEIFVEIDAFLFTFIGVGTPSFFTGKDAFQSVVFPYACGWEATVIFSSFAIRIFLYGCEFDHPGRC